MRWILPLLSLAILPPAFGEIAVYTGTMSVQNVSTARPSIVRLAEVIDLSTGNIVTIGLTGGRTDFSYAVGPEVPYVVARTNDGHGHGVTAFAQASSNTDSDGSKFAIATNVRGRDMAVNLSDAGASQWPRTLTGTGSLVAAAGTDAVATPASASYSVLVLTLSEPYSKLANSSGGTLSQAAEVVAQQYRNKTAAALKFTPVNASVVAGVTNVISGTSGLVKSGAGTIIFGSTLNSFTGAVTLNGGTLRLTNVGAITGTTGATTVSGGTLQLSGITPIVGGVSTVSLNGTVLNGVVTTGYAPIVGLGVTNTGFGGTLSAGSTNLTLTTAGSGAILNTINLNPVIGAGSVNVGTSSGAVLILNNNTGASFSTINSGGLSLTKVGTGLLTTAGTGYNNVITLPANFGSVSTGSAGFTLSGGNIVSATGTVVGTVTSSGSVLTLDPSVLNLVGSAATSLTHSGSGTFVINQANGTTLTVTGNTTVPVVVAPVTTDPDPATAP